MEIGVSLVQLHGGELRVVLGIHALVAENPADLVHPIHAAHNEPLQGQFRGDAHVHIDIQRVVVGDKGTGGSAAGDGVQHGGLHLNVAHAVQIVAQVLDELGADDKIPLDLGIHHQVNVALTETGFLVGQTVEFIGQGQQGLAQQGDDLGADGNFLGLRLEDLALHADDVANVILLEAVVFFLAQLVDLHEDLDAAGAILQIAEHDLALTALAHQTSRDLDGLALEGFVVGLDGSGIGIEIEFRLDEGVAPLGLKRRQLFPPDLHLVIQRQLRLRYKLCHGSALAGNADHLHGEGAGRGVDGESLARGFADDGAAEGGVVGELELHGVGFLGTGDAVLGLLAVLVLNNHGAAQAYPAAGFVLVLDDDGVGQNVLDLGDTAVELGLLVLGGVVLGVFGQVAVGAGFGDHGGDFALTGGFQVIQFLFQVGKTQTGDLKFFCHIQNPFSDKNIHSSKHYRRIMPHSQVLFAVFGERMSARGRATGGR